MANYRLKLARVNSLKLRVTTRIPALLIGTSFITVTRGDGGEYFVNPDYTVLSPGPITDATTAYIAIQDASAGIYKTVTLASLLTSSLDADLQVIGALTGTGILSRTASGAWALRTLTGTANEITVTNGDGVSGNPTLSLPSAITTTGKTITGGTYAGLTITGSTFNGNTWTAGTGTLTLGAGKTATISNTLTFTGTDASSVAFGAGGTVAYTANNLSAFAATTSAQLRGVLSDETGTGAAYFQGGDLGTPSAGVLTSATGLPITSGISGLATGAATFLTTPSSANLRALLTDEVGTGAAYFIGGALGTPASATLTNGTGLPLSTGITGAGTGVLTALGVNVGTAGAVVVNGGALGTPSGGTLTNATGLPLSGLTSQAAYTIVMNNSGSSAVPTAVDVTALTAKASPVSADIVLIQDSAASNAFKRTTVGALASAGSVGSYNTRTGAVTAVENDVPLRGYKNGLTLSTAGSTGTFGIGTGVATDTTFASMMKLSSAYTKTTSSWAVGSGNGALDTGAIANNTWYHVYLIQRPDTGVVDVIFSLSASAPTLPTNYTLYRRIGSMKTNGSAQWIRFFQDGSDFTIYDPSVYVYSLNNPGTSAVTAALSTALPTGYRFKARLGVQMLNLGLGASYLYVSDLSTIDLNPLPRPTQLGQSGSGAGNATYVANEIYVYCDTSAQVRYRTNASTTDVTVYLQPMGWIDPF